ncbi:hypothetical protein LEP1GSC196_0014 [Leptospira meyeri serovar Semaranga str. Veldrot Semarang 173]|nr:hypothetical protein LEP1GSC196_0014 [Leptospira meyeri serovar Semaranga str. Veldrot Semarang 173]
MPTRFQYQPERESYRTKGKKTIQTSLESAVSGVVVAAFVFCSFQSPILFISNDDGKNGQPGCKKMKKKRIKFRIYGRALQKKWDRVRGRGAPSHEPLPATLTRVGV